MKLLVTIVAIFGLLNYHVHGQFPLGIPMDRYAEMLGAGWLVTPSLKAPENTLLHPILLVPGYMGSILEASFQRESVSNFCPRSSSGTTLWFSAMNYGPMMNEKCWLDNIRLNYDPVTRRSYPDKGVNVYTKGYGNGSSVDYISPPPQQFTETMYFYNMIEIFERMGYVRDRNVRGVPYDWRRAYNENEEFAVNFKALVEETYALNNGTPVITICHSMGCLFTYPFFQRQSPEWKEKYIKSWIVLGAPLGGTFKYLYGSFADDDYPASMFRIIRQAERTFSAKQFLMPRTGTFGDDVLIETSTKNYTAADYEEIFTALNQPIAYNQWLDSKDVYDDSTLASPGNFDILCVAGVSKPTIEKAVIDGELNPNRVRWKAVYGDGDGYVNVKSGRICQKLGENNSRFVYREINVEHMEMIRSYEGINVVSDFIGTLNRGSKAG